MRLKPAWPVVGGALLGLTLSLRLAVGGPIAALESAYQDLRNLKDQIDLTRARGADRSTQEIALTELLARYRSARAAFVESLRAGAPAHPEGDDRRALDIMKAALAKDLAEEKEPAAGAAAPEKVDCAYDPRALASGPDPFETLSKRMYACFGRAAEKLPFEGRTLDRLTVFSLLPVTDDAAERKRLFLALEPAWKAVNGDGGRGSPYRSLVRLSARRLAARKTSIEASAQALGIDPGAVEGWLTSELEAWRTISPDTPLEPWDFAYATGAASRLLRSAIPLPALRAVNDRFYRDLGADPAALGVHYDLDPREGKDPVAFTTFGARPQRRAGAWTTGEPWVFASYTVGSVDNLSELLHETGHAIHIAAIRARPAFEDWPDSDIYTEAIADVAALEMYEPEWQARYLGRSAPLAESLRAKYGSIVMDAAWSLFEIRMHRNPELDPNAVWTDITGRYFRITPHPELSWWAVRGQLINAPGYMLNYAVGAILVADARARTKQLHGPYAQGDPTWYSWVADRLYRFGLERTSRRAIEDFLGRPVSPKALLDDLRRAGR